MLHHVAAHLAKRGLEASSQAQLPPWTFFIALADILIFLPIIIYISYTLKCVYPVLVTVEDQNPPPAYEPLPISSKAAEHADAAKDGGAMPPSEAIPTAKPVTSSLRSIHRLLRSLGGPRAYFRGFLCLHVQLILTGALYIATVRAVPRPLASLVTLAATLALVQLSTTWVHIVMTPRSQRWFWQRLPPFKKTFKATAPAVVLYFFASEMAEAVPFIISRCTGIVTPATVAQRNDFGMIHYDSEKQAWLAFLISLSAPLVFALIGLPAQVVLFRVQASLLPADETTIVPFDRTFAGRVEPASAGGRGYATIRDVWASSGAGAWKRLAVLYVKLFFVDIGFFFVLGAVVLAEFMLVKLVTGN